MTPLPEAIPLSPAQQGVWLAEQELADNTAFACLETIWLTGPLDPQRWRAAVDQTLHETTVTRLALAEESQDQLVMLDRCPVTAQVEDLRGFPDPHRELHDRLTQWQQSPVDLKRGFLTHVTLHQLGDTSWAWSWRIHHLALDGFGFALLARRVAQIWAEGPHPIRLGSQPIDLAVVRNLATQKLPDLPDDQAVARRDSVDLGTSTPRPGRAGPGSTQRVVWRINRRLRPAEALTAVARAVHRASGATTCSIGLYTTARITREELQTPTCLQDVVPVLIDVDAWTEQEELLEQVTQRMRTALGTAGTRQECRVRALGGIPLADIWVNIVPFQQKVRLGQASGITTTHWEGPVAGMTVSIRLDRTSTAITVEAPDHDPAQVVEGFAHLLRQHISEDETPPNIESDHPAPLDPEEVEALLSYSPVARVVGPDITLDSEALVARVNTLAQALVEAGGNAEHPVVLALPRVADALVSQIAALQMGIPFITADPELGTAQVCEVAHRSGAVAVVYHPQDTTTELIGPWRNIDPRTLAHDAPCGLPARDRATSPHDTAYVMWTSGSTGQPKGVVVTRANLAAFVRRHITCLHCAVTGRRRLGDSQSPARVAHNHPLTFDSAMSPLAALLRGAEVHLTPDDITGDPEALADFLLTREIDMLDVSPAILGPMVDAGLLDDPRRPALIVVGGEACPATLWSLLGAAPVRAWNAYGPTEATVDATGTWIEPATTAHLGTALPGVSTRVLDPTLSPCPDGVAGELYLAGDGIAEGYLHAPDRTATRFLPDPWGPPGTRMYRTGDRVRHSSLGLEFLGRTDAQMSLRGRRVEPRQIEAVLDCLPGVARSAVRLAPGSDGPVLVGAVVPSTEIPQGWPEELLEYARELLPPALLPTTLLIVDHLPLTSRGKLDRSRLPVPDLRSIQQKAVATAPATPLEAHLATRAAEVLGRKSVGVQTNLRSLGLHSLASARLAALLRRDLQIPVRVADILANPELRSLARTLSKRGANAPVATLAPVHRLPDSGSGPKDDASGPQPASATQARLCYLIDTGQVAPAAYVVPVELTLHGHLDLAALKAALTDVVAAHPALHSLLVSENDALFSIPVPPQEVSGRLEVEVLERASEREWHSRARRSFNLDREFPIRATITSSDADTHQILLCIHHVAADGASIGSLLADLAKAYTARHSGTIPHTLGGTPALPTTRTTSPANSPERETALAAWRTELAGAPATTRLPLDRPRPRTRSGAGDQVSSVLNPMATQLLRRMAQSSDGTLFTVLHSALAGLLTRWGAGDDLVLGAVLSTRTPEDPAICFAVDTVALRTDLSGHPSFAELCRRVGRQDAAVFSRALDCCLGLDEVVRAVNPIRDARHHPLFQSVLVLQEPEQVPDLSTVGLSAKVRTLPTGTAKFDLTLEVTPVATPEGERLDLRWEYATDVLNRDTVARLNTSFQHLLSAWLQNPEDSLWDPSLVPASQVIVPASAPAPTAPPRWGPHISSLADAWRKTVKRHGSRIALTAGSNQLTYDELHAAALEVAARLQSFGVQRGDLVALAIGRGPSQVAALLGAMLSGAAYVPLDPAYPLERLRLVLDDSEPVVLVVDSRQTGLDEVRRAGTQLHIPEVDLAETPIDRTTAEAASEPGDIAYVLYTSGSTGRPKGVRVTHHNVLRLFTTSRNLVPCGPEDVWTLFHSYAFDFSVWEMYGALLTGGRLVIVPQETTRDPAAFARLVDSQAVTILNQTPSAFTHFITETTGPGCTLELESLRMVVLGGEALDTRILRPWWQRHDQRIQVINMYGITETTVHVTYQLVTPGDRDSSPVGIALPDLAVRLLDAGLHPVPPGAVGEIYVSGRGVSEGYLGRPELTATRFIPDPWGPPGSRMYRSGDLAVVDCQGALNFCGRGDTQVQLRGFRVELGEIEAALSTVAEVSASQAVVLDPGTDQASLVGYVTGPDPAETDPVQILTAVRTLLPPQSVPSTIVVLDAFPLTINGKLDISALPRPQLVRRSTGRQPAPGLEETVSEAFCAVLGLDEVGATESFFEIGGHSLTAVHTLRRLEARTGQRVTISDFFAHPSVESLAAHLSQAREPGSTNGDLASLLVLRPAPTGKDDQKPCPGIFCLHPAGGLAWCYSGLAAHLPASVPLWGLQARGLSGGPMPSSLAQMAQDYLEQIRQTQPEGPYRLLGWSLGGMVAHEVAVRLQDAGHEVGLLALLDAYPSEALSAGEDREAGDAYSALLAMAGIDDRGLIAELGRPLNLDDCVAALHASQGPMADLERAAIEALRATYAATAAILNTHQHRHFDGPLRFYRAARGGATEDSHSPQQWYDLVDEIQVIDVDANHRQMTRPAPLAIVGRDLARLLEEH